MKKKTHTRMKQSWDDRIFDIICKLFLLAFVIVVFYPIYYIVIASFSDPIYATTGAPLLYPKGVTFAGYEQVFAEKKLWVGYGNTIFYTVLGTVLGVVVSLMAGYAFSRKDLPGSGILMKIYVFTMYFGGGMIPTFLVVKNLGLVDTRTIMVIMGSISVYNIIIIRSTMISTIPQELFDAALIDGCRNVSFFTRIVVPLSKPIIAVMVLYIAVAHWNAYMDAVIYLTDSTKYPLQMILNQILYTTNASASVSDIGMSAQQMEIMMENMKKVQLIKYGAIVVSTAPIICVYPMIQKYFVKGVMIGSLKG